MRQNLTTLAAACLAAAAMGCLQAQVTNQGSRTASGGASAGVGAGPNAGVQYATGDLEDMRSQLLNLEDVLEQFAPLAPPNTVDLNSLRQAKTRIQQMPYQHLNSLRRGLSPTGMSSRLTQARQHLGNLAALRAARATGNAQPLAQQVPATPPPGFPVPSAICSPATQLINQITGAIQSDGGLFGAGGGGFNLSGTAGGEIDLGIGSLGASVSGGISYTPGSISKDGISNTGTAQDYTQSLANMRIPQLAILAADLVWFVADSVREFSQDACGEDILGENVQLACLVTDGLWVVAKAVDEGIHFCDDDLTGSVGDSIYGGLALVYSGQYSVGNELDTHIGSANTDIDTKIGSVNTDVDTKIGTVNTDIDTKMAALASQLVSVSGNITTQMNALTQAVNSYLQCIQNPGTCTNPGGGPVKAGALPASGGH